MTDGKASLSSALSRTRAQRDRFVAFAFASADFLVEIDASGAVGFVAGAAAHFVNMEAGELAGRSWLYLFAPEDRAMMSLLALEAKEGQRSGPVAVRLCNGKDGEGEGPPHYASLCLYRMPGNAGPLYCAISRLRLTEAAGLLEERRERAGRLFDRAGFAELAKSVTGTAREAGVDAHVTLLEVDGLEAVREGLAGDRQGEVDRELEATLRAHAAGGEMVGRLSGSRFGVIHASGGEGQALQTAVSGVVEKLSRENAIDIAVRGATIALNQPALGVDEAIQAFSFALGRFVNEGITALDGRNMEDLLQEFVNGTVRRIEEFRSTISTDSFSLAFQPVVRLSDRKIHHFEVLARFSDTESPFGDIRFAEETGIIGEFDLAVLRRCVGRLRDRVTDGRVNLAVNVSGRSLGNEVFVKVLLEILGHNRDISSRLALEITESSELGDLARVDAIVQEIRRLGHEVCIDDFGAGSASFQYLNALTIDHVKLDGAYVKRIEKSRRDLLMLRSITRLCRDLSVGIIGEMVETERQARLLQDMGAELGQGWLFGKAVPEPVMTAVAHHEDGRKGG